MSGWYNPLPIGQSATSPTGGEAGTPGRWWIMVFPVAGTVRGHSSPTHGPLIPTTRVALSASPYHIFTTPLTARVRYFSRSLLPTHPPWQTRIAPSLPHQETSVVTISRSKSTASHAPPPTVESDMRLAQDTCVFSLGLLLSWVFLYSLSVTFS